MVDKYKKNPLKYYISVTRNYEGNPSIVEPFLSLAAFRNPNFLVDIKIEKSNTAIIVFYSKPIYSRFTVLL